MHDKIKVLFLASDPFHRGAPLKLDEEVRAIGHAIRRGRARDSVELVPHFATRTRDLREALLQHEPQIVHFSGHGASSGGIYLGDEHGRRQQVESEPLRKLFGLLDPPVRVVVLNGCHTLSIIEMLSEVVDFTVGMNDVISDDAAIVFAEAFYSALAMGRPVSNAFDWAVVQLELESNAEAATPERRVRPGADPDLSLVAARPVGAETPATSDTTGAPAGRAGEKTSQVQEFSGPVNMDGALFEAAPSADGAPSEDQVNRFTGEVTGRNFIFRKLG